MSTTLKFRSSVHFSGAMVTFSMTYYLIFDSLLLLLLLFYCMLCYFLFYSCFFCLRFRLLNILFEGIDLLQGIWMMVRNPYNQITTSSSLLTLRPTPPPPPPVPSHVHAILHINSSKECWCLTFPRRYSIRILRSFCLRTVFCFFSSLRL